MRTSVECFVILPQSNITRTRRTTVKLVVVSSSSLSLVRSPSLKVNAPTLPTLAGLHHSDSVAHVHPHPHFCFHAITPTCPDVHHASPQLRSLHTHTHLHTSPPRFELQASGQSPRVPNSAIPRRAIRREARRRTGENADKESRKRRKRGNGREETRRQTNDKRRTEGSANGKREGGR